MIPLRLAIVEGDYTGSRGRIDTSAAPHHRGAAFGPGDVELALRYRFELDRLTVDLRGGAFLPLAKTEPNPFLAGRLGLPHEHVFFGHGTFDPIVGFRLSAAFDPVRALAYGWMRLVLYDNEHGYRAGHAFTFGAGGELGPPDARVRLLASVHRQLADRWDGADSPEAPAKTDVALTAAARLFASGGWPLEIALMVPLTVASSIPLEHESPVTISVTVEHEFAF